MYMIVHFLRNFATLDRDNQTKVLNNDPKKIQQCNNHQDSRYDSHTLWVSHGKQVDSASSQNGVINHERHVKGVDSSTPERFKRSLQDQESH